jgi:hypothetical protein
VVAGAHNDALDLRVGNVVLSGRAPSAHAELAYQHNLRLLAASPGLPLLIVGRVAFNRRGTLLMLAIGSATDVPLQLPTLWAGKVNLGLDQLQAAYLHGTARSTVATAHSARGKADDPLSPFRQRLQQVLLGGRAAISRTTWSGVARDEATLVRNHMLTAAQLLRALQAAPLHSSGVARRDRLACAWLAGRTYLTAASGRLERLAWLRSNGSL